MRFKDDAHLWFELIKLEALWIDRLEDAKAHPAFFLHHVKCVDSRSGEVFRFTLLNEEECESLGLEYRGEEWGWQREYLDWVMENEQTITLKGRQLGVTWVWAGLALWTALFRPGSDVLVYSIKEDDASEVIGRIWDMWLSLPDDFQSLVKVIKPGREVRPSTRIEFQSEDGRVSTITGMAATKSAGHGRAAALIIFDEASRQEYARELWKAVIPASGDRGGKIGVVSTANGMSDGKGQGNFFHELWVGAERANYPRLKSKFLGWELHPDRDARWYNSVALDEASKAEQYPNDPDEAFLLSGSPFFSTAALRYYSRHKAPLLYQMEWRATPYKPNVAKRVKGEGTIEVYREPELGRKYALAADVATGGGADFSVGAVIDLHDGTPCAELYMKGGYEDFAEQLHFLGLWFNHARLAVEKGGGWGDTVIAYLRDGLKGRKPYPMLYRHRPYDRPDRPQTIRFGFPMDSKTRPKVINELRDWIEDKSLPWMPQGLYSECQTFVRRETKPSPRATDGCNDDRVMAWAIALEMYSQFGEHEHDRKKGLREGMKKHKPTHLNIWSYT